MSAILLALTFLTIISWGLWGFFTKIAVDRIGLQEMFWSAIISFPLIIGYLLAAKQLIPLNTNKTGILYALLAALIGTVGSILFIILLRQKQASLVVPFTALYPVVTIVLAFSFLKEKISLTQFFGVILALVAVFLVSRP